MFKRIRSVQTGSQSNLHPFTEFPFLVASGLGRSGTTVLRNSLCRHPQIAGFNLESNYIFDLMRVAERNLQVEGRVKDMPVTTATYWLMHQQLLLNIIWPTDQWVDAENKKVISTYSMLDPKAAIGLKKSFSKVAICYIVRNGIEVVSSYMSFAAFQNMTFEEICQLWALRHDMFKFAKRHSHVFLFRYEWFQEPQKFKERLSEALAFVGLDYDDQCELPLQTVFHPTVFDGESRQAASELSQRRERWKYWSPQQRDEFVVLCGEAMKAQGYEIPWLNRT